MIRICAVAVAAFLAVTTSVSAQTADLLVVNKIKTNGNQPGNVAFLNRSSGKVVVTVPVGNEPHEAAVSPDGKYAVVSNTGSYQEPSNSLSVIDVAARKEIHRVDLGPLLNPHGLIASGGLFFFTAEGARAIGAYDPQQNRVAWIMGTGQDSTHMLISTRDGRTIVATNRGSASVSIFQLSGGDPLAAASWKHTIVPVCGQPEGLDLSPDATQVWVGCRAKEISIIDLAQSKVADRFSTGNVGLARVKFVLNGKYLLGTDGWQGNVILIDAASRQVVKTLQLGQGAEAIFVEPAGRQALISVTGENYVAEVNLPEMTVARRISTGLGPDGMAALHD